MEEKIYICLRFFKAWFQSILFYAFRIFPIQKNKIVFCCIEGTTGYSCNPKYIAEDFIRQKTKFKLVWLVNNMIKKFPKGIHVVHNSLWNRAYQLTTAAVWIDNSRKQLEVRKRKKQLYIQTWHAKLGFKPTCLDRGKSFSKIAYYVSKHDSGMIDYVLSNSDWYDKTLHNGMLYDGPVLRTGSPRCDILVKGREKAHSDIRKLYNLGQNTKIIMYAPTFRGGSQSINRKLENVSHMPDFNILLQTLKEKFSGSWVIFLRLHPQMTVRDMGLSHTDKNVIDISKVDDMYELLSGCDAFLTDYSSAAFDAAVMHIPIFLYADDYEEYELERGKLLWNLTKLPFPLIRKNEELKIKIQQFDKDIYEKKLEALFSDTGMIEDGNASKKVVKFITKNLL